MPRPPVELLLAPAACGKTTAVIELLAERRNSRALALVPSRAQQLDLYKRLGRARGVRAVQFSKLAHTILKRAGGAPDLLGDTARLGLTRALLGELRAAGQMPAYAAVAGKRGFVAAVADLLTDLGTAGIAPGAFAAAARSQHDAELAEIYRHYVAFQEEHGVADLPRLLALACDILTKDERRKGTIYRAPTNDERPRTTDDGRGATDDRRRTTDHGPRTPGLLDEYELLVVDGFDQFAPLQLALLAALARHIPRTVITLTLEQRDRPAHRRFARTYADLCAALDVRATWLDPDPGRCAAPLRHLESHMFDLDEDAGRVPAEGAVTLIEAADREREVRAVLRKIKRLIDDGASPHDIAILFRDGTPYTALLHEVAAEYGLPLDIHEGLPLDQSPPIAALLGLLRLSLDDYPRRALIETLRSPYTESVVRGQRSVATVDDPPTTKNMTWATDNGQRTTDNGQQAQAVLGSRLDAVARYRGIAGGLARWRRALEELAAAPVEPGEDENPPPVTPDEAAALLDALERFCVWVTPPDHATVAEYVAWVSERATGLRFKQQLFEARDRAAIDRFTQLLQEMVQSAALLEAPMLPFRAFFDDLADAAAAARYRLRGGGGVVAMPVLAARGLVFAHVAILGLNEGEFPRPLQEPAIYRRAERRALREERGLPLPAPDPADERTIFYEAIARARRGLILARTRLDESGNPLARSPYLTSLLELLEGVEVITISAGSVPVWEDAASPEERALALVDGLSRPTTERAQYIVPRRPTTGEESSNVQYATHDMQQGSPLHPFTPSPLQSRIEAIREEYPAWDHVVRACAIEAAREGLGAYGPFEGVIADADLAAEVARRFGPEHRWSVTEFNDHITCPFRFVAAHVLRVAPRYDVEDALDSGRRGQLYHAILARAGERWRAARLALTLDNQDAALAALDSAAQEVLDGAPERFGFAPSAYWGWERDEVRRRLRAALRGFIHTNKADWQEFEPAAVEQSFGGRHGAAPLRVETPAGPALVRGRIDRVDRREDGALAVVDYKSGGARSARDALEGRDLQLPIYILAVEQVLAAGQQVERAAFFQIGSGKRGGELKGEQLREALQVARERVTETIAAVHAADFRVRPRDKCPDYCEFEAICRRNLEKRRHH